MTDPYQPTGQPNPNPPPPDPYVPPAYQPQPYAQPTPYAQADPYAQPAYQQPAFPYGYQPPRPTEGLAIASLVVSCVSVFGLCFYGIGALLGIVGAILGHVARRRIARDGSNGAGMALAGIITGWIVAALGALGLAAAIIFLVANPNFS
ncbi:DUF4190 domain-containing protein [Paractinoplanes durhamensis]|uniref:DUF4190 domain-containing protein n=1 Tax=Paractinoplanes durhamensis TaxID=113563 RepID=A0ABQ3YPT8_9ACTN|nr:DUF4190 domain-containing protein [Actinoplanes durhamensis]GID99590.1 hypothetical protein Adu01nite_09410 [Actinoplanes durhamensis]